MKACFTHIPVPPGSSQQAELIDHRFFFYRQDDKCGDYTCGVARKAVADALFHHQEYFSDANFLDLLPRLIDNPPTTGFFMEYGVLFYLQSKGIPGHTYLGHKMKVVPFNNDIPQFEKDIIGEPVLYHPLKFNYETLNGIIVYIMKDDDVRMTVAPAPAKEGCEVAKKDGKNKTTKHTEMAVAAAAATPGKRSRKGTEMATAAAAAAPAKIRKKTGNDTEMAVESNLGDRPDQPNGHAEQAALRRPRARGQAGQRDETQGQLAIARGSHRHRSARRGRAGPGSVRRGRPARSR